MNGNNNVRDAKIVPFESLALSIQEILHEAVEVRLNAYCPYSNFQVGACLVADDGSHHTGCNAENASYTVGTCAERCAFFKALSVGKRKFKELALIAYQENFFTTPCGACRQFLREFGDFPIYISKPELKEVMVTSIAELLPFAFTTNQDKTY